jgi:hypothetical protein
MSNLAVSAGITVVSYRETLLGESGLSTVWYANAEEALWRSFEAKGIDPTSISDTQWQIEVRQYAKQNPVSDLKTLRDRIPGASWSAPKQNLVGGVLFFYLGDQRPRMNVNRCLKEAKAGNAHQEYIDAIQEDKTFIDKYARTLFGMAPVTSIASYGQGTGFRGRVFADVASEQFHLFEKPLSYDFMVQHGQTTYGNTVLTMPGSTPNLYRDMLRMSNTLPDWFEKLTFGDNNIPFIDSNNWLSIVPSLPSLFLTPEETSSPEQKVCYYFVNHLVNAIQDPGETYQEQNATYRNGQMTGRADYFLKMHGTWIPLEAKVTINAERDFAGQLDQYLNLSHFTSRVDHKHIHVGNHGVCIAADQYGVYLTKNGQFVGCAADAPRWERAKLTKQSIQEIRQAVAALLKK